MTEVQVLEKCPEQFVEHPRAAWFRSLGLGLFVHWGPYSVLGRGEWCIQDERIPTEQYDEITRRFTASRFDPRAWVRLAREAGARYLVLTCCHGDGYCLFRTSTYPRNAVQMTPGRDLVEAFVEACREGGMGIGLYYGLSNWYEFRKRFGGYKCLSNPLEMPPDRRALWDELVDMKHEQVRELLTQYGPIDMLWFDDPPSSPEAIRAGDLHRMIRRLQPEILVNSRGGAEGDIDISEEKFEQGDARRLWEVCMPLAIRWGYHRGDRDYKTIQTLLRMMRIPMTRGGNFLINTGPYEDGRMQPEQEVILRELGRWLARQGESIFGTQALETEMHAEWGEVLSWDGADKLYVHVDRWMGKCFAVSGVNNRVLEVRLLSTGEKVTYRQEEPGRLILSGLPAEPPDPHSNVFALRIQGKPNFKPWLTY